MFTRITSKSNLKHAYELSRRGKLKHKVSAIDFEENETYNLKKLQKELIKGYTPKPYTKFYIRDPKRRLIYAPAYVDKIVHHAINNILHEFFKKKFIADSYACIKGRGHSGALDKVQENFAKAHSTWENPYILNIDIRKFFYTIDHAILISILKRQIKCSKTLNLLENIIKSSPTSPGLPLGNLISQLLANVYLNEVDQFAKRKLGIKFYTRYADDITCVLPNKKSATIVKARLIGYLNYLKLEAHPVKTVIRPLRLGLTTLGFKVYPTHISMGSKAKRRKKYIRIKITQSPTRYKKRQILNSWIAHIKKSKCKCYKDNLKDYFKGVTSCPLISRL